MKLLDCTLRDGGYYTNWDFSDDLLQVYLRAMNESPIDYVEIGYRAKPEPGYQGRFYYCPDYLVNRIASILKKQLVFIIDEKNCLPGDMEALLSGIKDKVAMVRITVAPTKIEEGIALAAAIKKIGIKVAFNLMYISKIANDTTVLAKLSEIPTDVVDVVYLVDSYGGILPDQLKQIIQIVKSGTSIPLGFHGHNNMEMALANTIAALDNGVEYIDATITGMGRGAGNLKTELLLTYLSSKGMQVDFNALSKAVSAFEELRKDYGWGTNLPYMVSGAYSLPQKEVMDWTTKRFYSYNGILQALINKKSGVEDNVKLPVFDDGGDKKCLVIGGGQSILLHQEAILRYLDVAGIDVLVFSSSKHVPVFQNKTLKKIYCIQGKEADRLDATINHQLKGNSILMYAPFPRQMGTQVPQDWIDHAVELPRWQLTPDEQESHLRLALETALLYKPTEIIIAGFDGYNSEPSSIEFEVAKENDLLFKKFRNLGVRVVSITPSRYKNLDQLSIYSLLT
ncbi:aldolase catalytic domain-containing protein [Flavihumibacter sp. UBA7668]|uniref:aldolase catalytic domain-containing protein n=1 Tax=Flavihumibacter sp. UBA7668 TaxID=1946542 RepID=UPI0025C465D9|nr:aldolase catalytic domain-containing protein [Flavihumibacter sp. UBA7668]